VVGLHWGECQSMKPSHHTGQPRRCAYNRLRDGRLMPDTWIPILSCSPLRKPLDFARGSEPVDGQRDELVRSSLRSRAGLQEIGEFGMKQEIRFMYPDLTSCRHASPALRSETPFTP
jgi:hypothetical protein